MNKKALQNEEKTSMLFWLLAGFVALFLFWAPFQKALFNGRTYEFERPLYTSLVWGFIVLVIASLYLFYHWKLRDHRDLLSLAVWLLPLTYLLSKISEASHYYATNMFYIQMLYSIFFILGIYLCRGALGYRIITSSLLGSGYVVVWFGIFNWLGYKEASAKMIQWFVDLPDKSGYRDAVMSADNQLRLTSTFQYANSYAAFLIALLLGAVYLIVTSAKKKVILINAFMLVPIIISILLTISRGGLVVIPIIMLLILPFMKITNQIFFFIHLFVASLISLIILGKVTAIGEQFYLHQDLSSASTGLWIMIGSSAACAVIIWALQQFVFERVQGLIVSKIRIRYANFLVPAAALVLGAIGLFVIFGNTGATNLFPDYIKQRIENINFAQHSVLERGSFYKDASKLFADYPLIGAGGGAWAALYEKYQSYPYISREAHNFFVQYLTETGIVGILVLLGLLVYVFVLYIRAQIKKAEHSPDRHIFFIVAISLLVHSLIDFDLSYVFLGIVVFLSLGAMISKVGDDSEPNEKWNDLNKYKWTFPSLLLIVGLIMFFNSAHILSANSNFRNALSLAQSNKGINEIFASLDNALEQHPNHPDYASYKIDILFQAFNQTKDERFYNDAVQLIQATRQKEPSNRNLVEKQIYAFNVKQQYTQALDFINQQIGNFPWDITLYEKNISLNFSLGEQARQAKNAALKDQYWNQSKETYTKMLAKAKELEALPKEQSQGRDFGLTKSMAFTLGQIDYIRGDYTSAENFLKFGLTDQFDDQMNKQMTRWYLAALQKQNKNDQALFDKLIANDPKERDEINRLANATF